MVFDDERLLNTGGLRYADECVRHKALDAIGDLALAGFPLIGGYRSVRGGHKLNHAVLTALMADRTAWRVVEDQPAPASAQSGRSGRRNGGRHGCGLWSQRVLSSARPRTLSSILLHTRALILHGSAVSRRNAWAVVWTGEIRMNRPKPYFRSNMILSEK